MALIAIGIESSCSELHEQISMHPERFFFVLVCEGRAGLCIQTCDGHGSDMKILEIGGLSISSEGSCISVFQEELKEAMKMATSCEGCLDELEYPITPAIKKKICELPGFIDWMMTCLLNDRRCLLLHP